MKKIFKRSLAVLLVIVMVIGVAPLSRLAGDRMNLSPKAEAASLSETDVFYNFPIYLNDQYVNAYEMKCQMAYLDVIQSQSDVNVYWKAFSECLSKGLIIDIGIIAAQLGITESKADSDLKDTTMEFLKNISSGSNALETAVSNIENIYNPVKKIISTATTLKKEEVISNIVEAFLSTDFPISNSEARKIAEDIWKHTNNSKTIGIIGSITDFADDGLTVAKFALQMAELYSINLEFINILKDNIDSSSDLYRGLCMVEKDRLSNPEEYIVNELFVDFVIEKVAGAIGELFNVATGGAYGVITKLIDISSFALSNYVFKNQSATDYIKLGNLSMFAFTLENALSELKLKFKNENGKDEDINKFKILYSAYIQAMKSALNIAYDFETDELRKSNCYGLKNSLSNNYTYQTYINRCIRTISEDIDAGVVDTTGKFTAVSDSAVETNILKRLSNIQKEYPANSDKTFIEKVGYGYGGSDGFAGKVFSLLYDGDMPKSVNTLYRYKFSSSENVSLIGSISGNSVNVTSVKNLLSQGKAGDIIVAHGENGTHMMIIVSIGSLGVTVYDCDSPYNIDYTKNLIQQYEFSYSSMADIFSKSEIIEYSSSYRRECEGGISLYRADVRQNINSGLSENLDCVINDDSKNFVIKDGELTAYNGNRKIVNIPEGVVSIADSCFEYNDNILEVNMPSTLKTISEDAFRDCNNLEFVNLNSGLEEIGSCAFQYCALFDIYIGKNVEQIGSGSFSYCDKIMSVTVDKANTYFTNDEYGVLFNKDKTILVCYPAGNGTKTYIIPDSVKNIEAFAFSGSQLADVTIGSGLIDEGSNSYFSNDHVNYAFCWLDSLANITVNSSNKYFASDENGVLFNKNKTELVLYPKANPITQYTIPDGVTIIDSYSFEENEWLENVSIPDSVKVIGRWAFSWCRKLRTISLSDSIESIGSHAFNNTSYYNNKNNWENGLLYLNNCLIGADRLSGNCVIKQGTRVLADDVFSSCNFESLTIPSSVVFNNNKLRGTIKSVIFENGRTYFDCCWLTGINADNIYIPASISEISNSNGSGLCKKFIVDKENQFFSNDEHGVLFNKDKTVLLNYPNRNDAEHYDIPDGVEKIENSSFWYCENLKSIGIPLSMNKIGYLDGSNITDIYYAGTKTQWEDINSTTPNPDIDNAKIHYNSDGGFDFFGMIASFFQSIINFFKNLFTFSF